jgi:hypothetical protein
MRFLIFVLVFLPFTAFAQDSTPQRTVENGEFFNAAHRSEIYEKSKKSELSAVGYTLMFPGFGNYYAQQYVTGTVVGMGMVFGLTALVFGLSTDQSDWTATGLVIGGSMYIIGGTTSVLGVQDYNADLKRALKVSNLGRAPGLKIAFQF